VITLNLLANGPAASKRLRPLLNATWLVATCVALAGYGWHLRGSNASLLARSLALNAELAEAARSAKNLDQARKRHADLGARLAMLGRILDERQVTVELFEAVSRSLPDGLWLTDLKRSAATVQLDGRAPSLSAVAALVRGLAENVSFAHPPEIRSVFTEAGESLSVLHFQIAGELALSSNPRRP
jgi:Tfp pilus assembly protein PilN